MRGFSLNMKLYVRNNQIINSFFPPKNGVSFVALIENCEQWWEHEGAFIMDKVQQKLGMNFQEESVVLYLCDYEPGGKSDPLVVSVNSTNYHDVIIHELIHRLLTHNTSHYNEDVDSPKLFPDVSELCARHIVVHAVSAWVYLDVLKRPDRLQADKDECVGEYRQAWNIVEKVGYQEIMSRVSQ
jgi:hypothetical protein